MINILQPPPALRGNSEDKAWAQRMADIGRNPVAWAPVFTPTGTLTLTSQTITAGYYELIGCMFQAWLDVTIVTNAGSGQVTIPNPVASDVLVTFNVPNHTIVAGVAEVGMVQGVKTAGSYFTLYRAAAGAFGAATSHVIRSYFSCLVPRSAPGVFT